MNNSKNFIEIKCRDEEWAGQRPNFIINQSTAHEFTVRALEICQPVIDVKGAHNLLSLR